MGMTAAYDPALGNDNMRFDVSTGGMDYPDGISIRLLKN
jgi:hypothetical protein